MQRRLELLRGDIHRLDDLCVRHLRSPYVSDEACAFTRLVIRGHQLLEKFSGGCGAVTLESSAVSVQPLHGADALCGVLPEGLDLLASECEGLHPEAEVHQGGGGGRRDV